MKWLIVVILWCTALTASPSARSNRPFDLLRTAVDRDLPQNARVQIEKFYTQGSVAAGASLVGLNPEPPLGLVTFSYVWSGPNGGGSTFGSAVVKAFEKVAVARVPIKIHEVFTRDNVRFEQRELSPYRVMGFFDNFEKLSKMRCAGFINPGSVIGYSQAELPFDVVQGETVDVVKASGALRLTAKMRAVDNGRANDWIRVENPSSHKMLEALVSGPGRTVLQ